MVYKLQKQEKQGRLPVKPGKLRTVVCVVGEEMLAFLRILTLLMGYQKPKKSFLWSAIVAEILQIRFFQY
jgi:hypothetical protein